MKKVNSIGFLSVILSLSQLVLQATVTFGSRDSTIQLASGTRFNVSSENFSISGTLKRDAGAALTGNIMTFDKGLLSSAGLEAVLDGTYDPTGDDTIRLSGNGQFRAEPGTVVSSLAVAGTGNRIEGQPLFSEPITLTDASTELTFAMQSKLNKNIQLNGGTVWLDDNLTLADDVKFDGTGLIELNHRQLRLGSFYSSAWTNNLSFNNATDVVLDGPVVLNGTWTFDGTSCLNGNGCVLDLSGGGQLIVAAGATLNLNDIHIVGLGDAAGLGKIVMNNAASTIKASNVTFKLNGNVTTSMGTLYVNGPSTMQLGAKNWTFSGSGNLTVDGTTLWLDYLDTPASVGTVLGNKTLLNNGAIKESVDMDVAGQSAVVNFLLGGNVSGTVTLDQCVCLGPNDVITLTGNTTINGQGGSIHFSTGVPQLIVPAGVTLTLENITLTNLDQSSFNFAAGSIINIGQNVIWELASDIMITSHTKINVIGTAPNYNVFLVRGHVYRRKLILAPVPTVNNEQNDNSPYIILVLGHNTMQLENVELSGFDHISFIGDSQPVGAIALSGSSGADIDSSFPKDIFDFTVNDGPVRAGGRGTAMNFFIEGLDNELILRRDGLVLAGNMSFGDYPDNHLRVRFNLTTPIDPSDPRRFSPSGEVQEGFPFVYLTGDPGIFLTSQDGNAWLEFLNFNACVDNRNTNAFTVDDNSLLDYKRLQILTNPIKQSSSSFLSEGTELIGLGIDPSFIRSPKGLRSKNILVTALHLQRQRVKDAYEKAQKEAKARQKIKPTKPGGKKGSHRVDFGDGDDDTLLKETTDVLVDEAIERGFIDNSALNNDEAVRAVRKRRAAKALNLPVFSQTHSTEMIVFDAPLTGNIKYDNDCVLTNVTSQADIPFHILLSRGTSMALGGAVALDATHKISVSGTGNKIKVTQDMTINPNALFFDTGAELTFEFPSRGEFPTTLTIADDVALDLEKNSKLTLSGPGRVVFGNVTLQFKGEKTVQPITFAEAVTSRAYMVISDNAALYVADDKTLRCRGVGDVLVTNNGNILPGTNASMLFGADERGTGLQEAVYTDDFLINVKLGGQINLQSDTGTARFGVHYATSNIAVKNCGMLFINKGGLFEVNADAAAAMPARLKNLAFGLSGTLFIEDTGIFSLGENRNNNQGQPYPFEYDGLLSSIVPGPTPGLVRFVGTVAEKSFTGRMNVTDDASNQFDSRTALEVIRAWVQQNTELPAATWFTGEDNRDYVRTKNGALTDPLELNDIIISEAADGTITGENQGTGEEFTIRPNGTIDR